MTYENEKSCCGEKGCYNGCCRDKKCKLCKFVGYVLCTTLISFLVVKFTAPCVVHDAFVKKVGEYHLRMMIKMAHKHPEMMHHFGHQFDPMMPFPPKGPKAPVEKQAK